MSEPVGLPLTTSVLSLPYTLGKQQSYIPFKSSFPFSYSRIRTIILCDDVVVYYNEVPSRFLFFPQNYNVRESCVVVAK